MMWHVSPPIERKRRRRHVTAVANGVDLTGLLGGHKGRLGVWGTEVPQRGPEQSPGRGSGGRSPPEAEAFFVKLHIIFALKYNKQQLLSLELTS